MADAFACLDDEENEVIFSDWTFGRVQTASRGNFDTFDSMRHDGDTLTLNFTSDGPTMRLDLSPRADEGSYSGGSCTIEYRPTIKVTSRTADRIAGRPGKPMSVCIAHSRML